MLLIGGPKHGEYIEVRHNQMPLEFHELTWPRVFMVHEKWATYIRSDIFTSTYRYYPQRWREAKAYPLHYKEVEIGVFENQPLVDEQKQEIQRLIDQQPFKFPKVSFLYEFDEWFAQAVYRHTGELTWKGERVLYG